MDVIHLRHAHKACNAGDAFCTASRKDTTQMFTFFALAAEHTRNCDIASMIAQNVSIKRGQSGDIAFSHKAGQLLHQIHMRFILGIFVAK
jgi:hypothetical protein